MRGVELNHKTDRLAEMQQLYGAFDLDVNTGKPTLVWERRNLYSLRLPFDIKSCWFDNFYLRRVQVNRRAAEALSRVFVEMAAVYLPEARHRNGLDEFVRCYNFGDGEPSLYWYGAAWQLSSRITGDTMVEVTKIFVKHGWTYLGLNDKKRFREFEFW